MVVLPKSGKEKTITQLVNEADEAIAKEGMPKMAMAEDKVKVGESEVTIADLLARLEKCEAELAALKEAEAMEPAPMVNEDEESEAMENGEDDDREAEIEAEKKKKNEEDEKAKKDEEKKKNSANFKALKNAHKTVSEEYAVVELSDTQVARGRARYGA